MPAVLASDEICEQHGWPWSANFATYAMPIQEVPPVGSETDALALANPQRRREFCSGRQCARRALVNLGFAPVELRPDVDGLPIWPLGVTGSISHGGALCFAAVARTADIAGVGVDVEPVAAFEPSLVRRVCRADERAHIAQLPSLATVSHNLFFSAKEAVYKCLYPCFGQFFEFEDIALELSDTSSERCGTFRVVDISVGPWGKAARKIEGKWAITMGHVFALAIMPRIFDAPQNAGGGNG